MAEPNTHLWRMADRLAGGELASTISRFRAEGFGLENISRRLFADHGIEVTRQTLASWCEQLDRAEAAS